MAVLDGVTRFVGRRDEFEAVRSAVDSVQSGRGRVVLVEGEAGIGKSRLVGQVCTAASSAGFAVFEGSCEEVGWARPFAALIDALLVDRSSAGPDTIQIAGLLDGDAAEAPSAYGPTSSARFQVVEALGAVVERLAADQPVLLALDDLHWADPSTLSAVRSIARRTVELPVAVVAAYRSGHGSGELHALSDDLTRAGASHVPVGSLDAEAVAALVTDLFGGQPDDAVLRRLTGAAGNPLFVVEFVRALSDDAVDRGSGELVGTPQGFRDTVLRRLGPLPEETNQLLRLASVLGTAFSPGDLATVAGVSVVDLEPVLQHAVARGVVEGRGARLAFRHSLVRDAVYEQIPEPVRRQLHREVGRALAAAAASPSAVAYHLGASAEVGDDEAIGWLREAARANASRAPAVAVELLERARELLPPSSRERDALLAELVMALAWAGRLAEAEGLATEVIAARPDPTVVGALRCGLVYALTWQGRPREALRHTEVDGESLPERDAVLLRAEAAVARMFSFDLRGAEQQAVEAATDAERLGHELALCHALGVQAWTATFAGRPVDAIGLSLRAVDIASSSESGEPLLAHPRFFPGMPLMYADRLEEAEAILQSGRRLAEDLGVAWSLPLYHAHLGIRRYIAGELDEAAAELEASLAVADEVGGHLPISAAASSWLAAIQLHRDDLEGAEATVATAMGRIFETGTQLGMGLLNWARALLLEASGKLDDALALLQMSWDLYMADGPVTDPWSAMAFVRLCVEHDQAERARDVLPIIDEQAAVTDTPFMRGQALRCRGLVEADAEILVAALAEYRECPRPMELAAACEDAGRHLGRAARSDGAALLDEAVDTYERLSASRDAARARARLRELGVSRGSRGPRGRAATGWDSLTASELKVLHLVAQRLSNPEVADRLYISRHTVESHLKHIRRKLGVSSRAELAAMARNAGVPDC